MDTTRESLLADAYLRHSNHDPDDTRLTSEEKRLLDKYNPKNSSNRYMHIVFWMISAVAVIHYTEFFVALKVDPRIHRHYLNPGMLLIAVSVLIGAFAIGYYHYFLGIKDYETRIPFAVPIATLCFLAGMLLLCIALWPLWSLFTPFILITIFLGTIFAISILPM